MKELVLHALWDGFWSAIPAVGFAMLFSVPPRFLKYCALVGALAHSMRMVLVHYGMPIEWATLAASSARAGKATQRSVRKGRMRSQGAACQAAPMAAYNRRIKAIIR